MSPRLIACRADRDYKLWLKFSDGLAGSVFLGNLIGLGTFALWRDPLVFRSVHPEPGAVVWDAGIRLDADVLRRDLEAQGIRPPRRPVDHDPEFMRFMARALSHPVARPAKKRRRRHG